MASSHFISQKILDTIQGDGQDGDHYPKALWIWYLSSDAKCQKIIPVESESKLSWWSQERRSLGRRQGFIGETWCKPFCSLSHQCFPPISGLCNASFYIEDKCQSLLLLSMNFGSLALLCNAQSALTETKAMCMQGDSASRPHPYLSPFNSWSSF